MAKNPVEEFLQVKEAFNLGQLGPVAKSYGKNLGGAMAAGAATGIGGAAFAGLTLGAAKLYDAATKTRDFNNMMEANPDLHQHHQADPAGFNRMFSALRTMAPDFTKEPIVAGTYMRNAMEGVDPGQRGVVAVSAARDRGQGPRPGPLTEAALSGFSKGVGMNRQSTGQTKTTYKPGDDGSSVVTDVSETTNRY
jgi:hypothetical protein